LNKVISNIIFVLISFTVFSRVKYLVNILILNNQGGFLDYFYHSEVCNLITIGETNNIVNMILFSLF